MARLDDTPHYIKKDEKNYVEEPFLRQLENLGWDVIRLDNKQKTSDSFRQDFAEVVMLPKLEEALKNINTWLEDDQIKEVSRRMTNFPKHSLIENNQYILDLLLQNTSVSENRVTGQKNPTVQYIDFKELKNNSFIAVSQMKFRVLGTEYHIIPDIILFVNGLPLVAVECKSLKIKDPIAEAIDQLLRYSEQRGSKNEGNQKLFYYNHFIIATCRRIAKFGTISTDIEKLFYRWTDPYPKSVEDLEHKGSSPNDQVRLIHGMLEKENLLTLLKSFTIFKTNDKGKMVKVVGRYQQFRAVKIIIKRLLKGKNKYERSGIVWHTQGSGKSLTMMFLVREMYRYDELKKWKVVFITDRTQLEDQLSKTSKSIGYTVKVANNIPTLKKLLATDSSDLIMGMIHKFQEKDLKEIFPELNISPRILVMTDEAHRSQYGLLGANLDRALPNATEIGFTGTPTEKTEKKYKDYIDKYTMRQSIKDQVTLEIVYEGRTNKAEVTDQKAIDKKFEDVFSEYNIGERLQIIGFGSRDAYLDAIDVIKEKAEDMVKHYIEQVFPNGFKAQVVVNSREAACRYKQAIDDALLAAIKMLEIKNPMLIDLEKLKKLKTAVIISGKINDKPHLKKYTGKTYHDNSIASFKMPFGEKSGDISGDVGIIIVNNMLLVGFDAPIEQVMYLDRVVKAHNLLQAIARVNRVYNEDKDIGFLVDYVGLGHHLKEALDTYEEKEQKEILDALKNDQSEINELIEANKKMWELVNRYNISDLNDIDAFFDLFYDEDILFEFILGYKELTRCMNNVLPKKEALEFIKDYNQFTEIYVCTARHTRGMRISMVGIPEKLRAITDEYLKSKGIDQRIAPISIIDENFHEHVQRRKRTKTKATEVEHAIRHHIEMNYDEDPELYASFAEAINRILAEYKNNWDMIYKKLEELRQKYIKAGKEPTYGLHRKKQLPIFRILKREIFENRELTEDEISQAVNFTQHIYNVIATEIKLKGFWENIPAKNRLENEIHDLIVSKEFVDLPKIFNKRKELISRFMEWAEKNHEVIIYAK